jgi:MFS family permease
MPGANSMNVVLQLRALPRAVRVIFAATLINRSGTMVLPYLALYLTIGLGEGAELAGTVLAAYGVGAVVAPMLAGPLVDRYGALRVMRGSLLGSGLLLFSYSFARGVPMLVGLAFLLALVAEAFRPASLAVVADTVPASQRKTAFAVIRFAINLGMSLGPAVGGLLVSVSFRALFLIDAVTSIAAGVLLAVVRSTDGRADARSTDRADATADIGAAGGAKALDESSPSGAAAGVESLPLGGAVRLRTFALFLVATFLLALVFFQFEASLPLFVVRDVHASEAVYGALITLNAVIIILTEIPLNLKMAAWPHGRSMALGACFVAIGFGVLALGRSLPLVVLSVPLWTVGEMIVLPSMSAFVSDLAPSGRAGSFLGLYGTAFGLGFAVGPFCGIYALDHFGSTVLWSGALLVGLGAAVLFGSLATLAPSSPAVRT